MWLKFADKGHETLDFVRAFQHFNEESEKFNFEISKAGFRAPLLQLTSIMDLAHEFVSSKSAKMTQSTLLFSKFM